MRICLIAYACSPHEGSEPGAGWSMLRAAAQNGHVVLITSTRDAAAVQAEVEKCSLSATVHALGPGLQARLQGIGSFRWLHSLLWHGLAGRKIRVLHHEQKFDLVHHVTYAADWAPTAATALRDVPLVWGPVGGYCSLTFPFFVWLGPVGLLREILRAVVTAAARASFGKRNAKLAALTVVNNREVGKYFDATSESLRVAPNVRIPRRAHPEKASIRRARVVGYAGNLLRLKGLGLLVDALAKPAMHDWRLELVGDGPDESWLRRRAVRKGVAERIDFKGRMSRTETLDWMQTISVFAFPSFRDSVGWALAEAIMMDCPVVVLDRSGSPTVTSDCGVLPVTPLSTLASRLASAINTGGHRAPKVWTSERLDQEVRQWYDLALSR